MCGFAYSLIVIVNLEIMTEWFSINTIRSSMHFVLMRTQLPIDPQKNALK